MTGPKYWHELELAPRILLDYGDIAISTPGNIYFECSKCGNCCRAPFYAPVSDDELKVLSSATKKNPIDFASINLKGEAVLSHVAENSIVRSSPGEIFLSISRCTFLNGKENLCMVYSDRPAICRTFPFILRPDGGKVVAEFIFETKPDYSFYCPGFYYGPPTREMYEPYVEGFRMELKKGRNV